MFQLLATMVTYLVVLLQFQISIPDDNQRNEMDTEENQASINETVAETTKMATTIATTVLTTLAKRKKKN